MTNQPHTHESVPLPWWLEGESTCEHCWQAYSYNMRIYCSCCDEPVCPLCVIELKATNTVICPRCQRDDSPPEETS